MSGMTLAWGLPGGSEWVIILIVALLIFGRRLPEVGRSIGRSIVEFKKGIKGAEDEMRQLDRDIESAAALPDPAAKQSTPQT